MPPIQLNQDELASEMLKFESDILSFKSKFCCGSLLPVFAVRVSVTFYFTCAHIILVRFRLLSGHLLGNSCSLAWPYFLFCILTNCNISYFPFWF